MTAPTVGALGVPFEVVVKRGKIREFAVATKAVGESWSGDTAPTAPPTYLTADRFWAGPDTSPLGDTPRHLARTLHGEQE